MGRMTRAKAAAVAQDMHVDAEAVLELPDEDNTLSPSDAKPATPERAVLGEIAPNSTESKAPVEIVTRKTRGRKKAEEEKAAEEEKQVEVVEAVDEAVGQDEEEAEAEAEAEQHALDATTKETIERLAKLRITSIGNAGPPQATGPTARDQDETTTNVPEPEEIEPAPTKLDGPASTMSDDPSAPIATQAPEQSSSELPDIFIDTKSHPEENEVSEPEVDTPFEAPGSPVATAVPKLVKDLRTESPGKRSTSNKENVQPVEPVVPVEPTQTATPSQDVSIDEADTQSTASPPVSTTAQYVSPSQNAPLHTEATQPTAAPSVRRPSSNKSEDPIEAMDELEDAVEKVNLEIPNLTSSAEKKRSEKPTEEKEKSKKAKPAPVVRMTKATQARLSMAQGGSKDAFKAPATTRPRPSTTLGRASSVRQSVVPSAARRDPKTTGTATKPDARPKKETVIPHSKPRPVFLSFPTPPPAPKSSKAPTKSTFQLPGEAVAAKLKAAREERLKREAAQAAAKSKEKPDVAAAEKKPAFRARPVPGTLKHTPSVRQTAASRARESVMNGGTTAAAPVKKGPASTTATTTARPCPSTSTSSSKPPAPTNLTVSKRPRPSSAQIPASNPTTNSTRNPSSASSSNPTHRSTSSTSTSTSKGKEVYARAAAAKEAAETSKREKEDAARKARAAAAERGRAASREWAEKQKARKAAATVVAAEGGAVGSGGAEGKVVVGEAAADAADGDVVVA